MPVLNRVALLAALAAVGCQADTRSGRLEVSWTLGRQACDEIGLAQVAAELFDFDSAAPVSEATAPCGASMVAVDPVPPGDYSLRLRGLNDEGCWTHSARRDDIDIDSGDVDRIDAVPLVRRARPLRIRWPFANGRDCLDNRVAQVEVIARGEYGVVGTWQFLCQGLGGEVRDLPRQRLELRVVALSDEGVPVADGTTTVTPEDFRQDPCAEVVEVGVQLEDCLAARCEGE